MIVVNNMSGDKIDLVFKSRITTPLTFCLYPKKTPLLALESSLVLWFCKVVA